MFNQLSGYQFTFLGLQWGLFVFLLGIAVIFLGVAIIIAVISIIGKILAIVDKIKKSKKQNPKAVEVVSADEKSDEIPPQVKAAIVAAISCYYFNQNSGCEFKVKKIKRI